MSSENYVASKLSEEGLAELFNYLGLKLIELDESGRILYLSPEAEKEIGPGRELCGQVVSEMAIAGRPDLESLKGSCADLVRLKGQISAFHQPAAAGGALSWNFRPKAGGGWLIVGGPHDGSEYLSDQTEQSIKLVQDHKRALDQSSIVAITDQRGVITYVNDTFCRISGYSRDELLGETHKIINSSYHGQAFFKDLWQTISAGQVWKGEIRNQAKDGSFYWVDTTIVPFIDKRTQRPYQYVAIRSDITKQKETIESLNLERTRSWHAEKMVGLGEMAAGIAHELGNPIASIEAWLDVMESQLIRGVSDLDKFLKTLPKVREDARRVKDIIRGMLTYARDGSRDLFHSENIEQLLKLVHDYCSYKLSKGRVEWRYQTENPYLEVECRMSEVSQVFVNFILNACDAIGDSLPAWIDIRIYDKGSFVAIDFMDSGPGVADDLVDKIWNPFFTSKPVGSGTGLGLSITRSIIENHNGRVYLKSQANPTCFRVELPKRQLRSEIDS